MKTKTMIIATMLLTAVSLSAKQYPDSVRQASAEEPNIAYGWNFEFEGGLGVGSYLFDQLGSSYSAPHTQNKIKFPAWHAGIGINYYFVPWMGIGTGAQFSAYPNRASITKAWTQTTQDVYNDEYTITSTPNKLREDQNIYMVEIPLALKFRARPGVVGFTGTAGVKIGIPVATNQNLGANGMMENSVYYPFYDLTMSNVPGVVENLSIPSDKGRLGTGHLRTLNYAAYLELGMLIRLHQRVELAIAAYGNYYFTDLLESRSNVALGFADGRTTGKYPMPYNESYAGVLRSNEVKELHPWSVGLKIGLQINANRTKAQRDYDREQRRLRKAAQQQDSVPETISWEPEPVEPVIPRIVEDEPVIDPREEAIKQILLIAEENNIDICRTFCTDTIAQEPEPEPVDTRSAAEMLEDELQTAVIYFDLDKAIPILEPEDILIRIADILKRHPNQQIHVNGHACKLGKPDYNKRLALRRAKAVAAQLRELGVKDEQMIIASLGDNVPFRYKGKHQLSKDRRVEIVPVGHNQKVEAPVVEEKPATPATPAARPQKAAKAHEGRVTEKVKAGSRLAQIARRHYGNPDYWIYIYEANRDKLSKPSELPVGIDLVIPSLEEIKQQEANK